MRLGVEELSGVSIFAGLPAESMEQVASWFEERHAEPGEDLTPEGASGYTFFVIVEGTATVVCAGQTIATLCAGDYFGEGALLAESGRRNASVIAESPMRLGAMFGTEFRLLERNNPDIAAQIKATLAERVAQLPV